MTKICSKCLEEKSKSEFYKDKRATDGLSSACKKCCTIATRKWQDENLESVKIAYTKWRKANPEKMKESYKRNDSKRNKQHTNKVRRARYKINPHKINARNKQYRLRYPKQIINYFKCRKLYDPLFKLSCNVRSLIGSSMRRLGYKKTSKTADILGCTFEEFKTYIESQFTEGMSWDNRSLWHLDHIYPVSRALNEEHLLQLNHYTNFQPLWAEDNIRKGNKLPEELI